MLGWLWDGLREPLWALRVLFAWGLALVVGLGMVAATFDGWDRWRMGHIRPYGALRKIAVFVGGLILARFFIFLAGR